MWCPKCKNEYITGITHCKDCDTELVETLPDASGPMNEEAFAQVPSERTTCRCEEEIPASAPDVSDQPEDMLQQSNSHAFISKKSKKEDLKSTAYTFTLVGAGGLIFLALFLTGVLPFYAAGYMKIMIGIVMGILFFIFLIIGFRSFHDLKGLVAQAVSEENEFQEITEWFRNSCSAAEIDSKIDTSQTEEQLYFSRYELMSQHILTKYSNLEESFLDHIIEILYAEYFS